MIVIEVIGLIVSIIGIFDTLLGFYAGRMAGKSDHSRDRVACMVDIKDAVIRDCMLPMPSLMSHRAVQVLINGTASRYGVPAESLPNAVQLLEICLSEVLDVRSYARPEDKTRMSLHIQGMLGLPQAMPEVSAVPTLLPRAVDGGNIQLARRLVEEMPDR